MKPGSAVVVSGAHGFIGSQLVRQLTRTLGPERVISLVRQKTGRSSRILSCDLSDAGKLAVVLLRIRPSIFFHAAGGSQGTLDELMAGNLFTTLALFRAMARLKHPMRAVILGSAAEYGKTSARSSAANTPLRPGTPYAWTKACQTLLAQQAAISGLDVVAARLFNITGPGVPARFSIGSFARQIADAERAGTRRIDTGNLDACRDFIDIRDAVSAILLIAKKGKRGEIYDVCSGRSFSMRRLLDLLLQQARLPLRIHSADGPRAKGDIPFSLGNPRLLKQLGWKPSLSLTKSLADTLSYYRGEFAHQTQHVASSQEPRL